MKLEAHQGTLLQKLLSDSAFCSKTASFTQNAKVNAGQLTRAAVELAKLWRTDKYLRRLDVHSRNLQSRSFKFDCRADGSL